jgi:hypothetical protein
MKRHADILLTERKDELKAHIEEEIGMIKDVLPWANLQILGTGYRSNSLVEVMEEIGLRGLWGSCPFQIGTDGITDFGSPWGHWYINPSNFKKPKKYMGKVINLEWTARDLNKAFHFGQAEAYSTDPNDVESQKKCTDTNIEYWKQLLEEYLSNLGINEYIFFQQHQEAHEMEVGPVCLPFTKERVEFTSKMLDLFLDHVVAHEKVQVVDANESLRIFHDNNKGNQVPSYMCFRDIPIYEISPEYKRIVKGEKNRPKHIWLSFNEGFYNYIDRFVTKENYLLKTPPWEHSFFYFDADCMLVFDKPQNNPVWICNYTDEEGRQWDDELLLSEKRIPLCLLDQKMDDDERLMEFLIAVKSEKFMPYGVAIWGNDFDKCEIVSKSSMIEARIINKNLLFSRFNIKEGVSEYSVSIKCNLT